ncbi:hypothetical protein M0805_008386 [Coniferiporia weirii]|nr:hypothetical protein M0805_008386 [Coniferiporia weirii]
MRKGHGSTKVPGVRLRPAAPTKTTVVSTLKQPAWAQSSADDDVDAVDASAILKSCKKPFTGVVVCASGVSDKVNLFQQAIQLGAQTSSDLTDRVTHLICEGPGSAKYTYCVEHGIPIMQPSWINDSYVKWLSGESVDVDTSIDGHSLPVFRSVTLCLTAFDDVQKRKRIRRVFEKHGGTYVDTLGKGSRLTHLLCGPDRNGKIDERGFTPKMQYVEKANKSNPEKTVMVWEEWLWDCIEFNGILDEKDYLIANPQPQRRLLREASTAEPPAQEIKTSSSSPDVTLANFQDVEEMAIVKRLPETTARLWEGLLKNRGFEVKSGKLSRNVTKAPSMKMTSTSKSEEDARLSSPPLANRSSAMDESSNAPVTNQGSSLAAAFKRTKSLATKSAAPDSSRLSLQRIRSTPASASTLLSSSSFLVSSTPSLVPPKGDGQIPEGEQNLFTGLRFRALGDADEPKLTQALELRGGTVHTDPEADVDFIIVRLASGGTFYRKEPSGGNQDKYRTECWIEQCIFEEKICAVGEHPAFVPLGSSMPISGTEKLVLHVSGLSACEKTPSVRLIKAIGATVTDQLSRRNTHLICPCGSGLKFAKAREWGIPVVNLEWLYKTVTTGEVQSASRYLVSPASCKGAQGGGITDITNNEFIQGSSTGITSEKISSLSCLPNGSVSVQTLPTDTDTNQSWVTNGLLSESIDQPLSLSLSSGLSLASLPSTPLKRRTTVERVAKDSVKDSIPDVSPTKKQSTQLTRIPSSSTPSPLKMPVDHETTSTLSGDSANVLKDAITSLLGKRPSSDDCDSHAQPGRNGKRSKMPPRSKSKQGSFSRTTSSTNLTRQTSTNDYLSFVPESDILSIEPTSDAIDESMRVTYEDPSQRDEKRRLLSLINNEPVEPAPQDKPALTGKKGRGPVRRASGVVGSKA